MIASGSPDFRLLFANLLLRRQEVFLVPVMEELVYPERSSHFAHRAFRLMHKASVAAEIGRDAFCIVAVVLHTEDAARYRGPVRFFNSQLMETLGFGKWETFDRARRRAIESGWLRYHGDGKRSAGLYFVTVPDGFESISDDPIEPGLYPQNGYKEGYDRGYKEGIIEGIKRGQSGVRSGDEQGEPYIPTPDPIPIPEDKHITAVAVVAKRDATPPPYNLIASQYVAAFGGTTHLTEPRRKVIRARWKDEWWRENWQQALDRGSGSAFLNGGGSTGWKISFDFFLKPDSVARILEGAYDGGQQNKNNLTSAERTEQLNADSFQWAREQAERANAASGSSGDAIPYRPGATLFIEEHGEVDEACDGDVDGGSFNLRG